MTKLDQLSTASFACIGLLLVAFIAAAQGASPAFDVASIKRSAAARPGRLVSVRVVTTTGRLTVTNATLKDLIAGAYSVESYQVFGNPGWMESARFDVEGKTNANATREERLLMLRAMLAERFKLVVHRESKELAIDALMVDEKRGPKFHPLGQAESSCWPSCKDSPAATNHMRLRDLPSLASYLTRLGPDRPVVDKTGLKGNFAIDFDVLKAMPAAQSDGGPPSNAAVYEATIEGLQEQLGLKVVPVKAPIEVLVIDRAEQPTPN
jgi:uncharacterized protein (TIGR03435 family)